MVKSLHKMLPKSTEIMGIPNLAWFILPRLVLLQHPLLLGLGFRQVDMQTWCGCGWIGWLDIEGKVSLIHETSERCTSFFPEQVAEKQHEKHENMHEKKWHFKYFCTFVSCTASRLSKDQGAFLEAGNLAQQWLSLQSKSDIPSWWKRWKPSMSWSLI